MLLSSLLVGAQGEAASVRLDSQSGHWALPAGIALSGSTLKLPYGGVAVYTGQEVGDEYVEYTQRIEAPGDWIGLQMRQADPAQDAFKQDCYMFRFDQTMVQLHKTSGGQFGELTGRDPHNGLCRRTGSCDPRPRRPGRGGDPAGAVCRRNQADRLSRRDGALNQLQLCQPFQLQQRSRRFHPARSGGGRGTGGACRR